MAKGQSHVKTVTYDNNESIDPVEEEASSVGALDVTCLLKRGRQPQKMKRRALCNIVLTS